MINILEKIEVSENIGRKYLESIIHKLFKNVKQVNFSSFSDKHDCIILADNNFVVEIKVRTITSNTHPDYMIEEHKYKSMMSWVSKGYIPIYVNFFTDGVCLAWNLLKADNLKVQQFNINKLNVNPDSQKVIRDRILLDKKLASKFTYKV